MRRYIAIDTGKFATKVAEYIEKKNCIRKFSIRTKVGDGDFRDDAIEDQTVIIETGDKVYKVGNGARGNGASLKTDKKDETHKICVLAALATLASAKEVDEIDVAVGLPAKIWAIVSERCDYKDYILPSGEVTVSIKKDSASDVVKKTFKIVNKYVFPESMGALFMDETIGSISPTTITGVIDIGNVNLNATLWQGVELVQDKSVTAELGGSRLIQELSSELSDKITRCDEMIAANILKDYSGERSLPTNMGLSKEQIEESKQIIRHVLLGHADTVKRCCHNKNWSMDITKIIAIGGTSVDIEQELKEVFGENLTVLPNSTYCNVFGYLRMLCSKAFPDKKDMIPLTEG